MSTLTGLWNEALRANGLSASCPLGDEHTLYVSGDGDHLACRKCHRTYKMQDDKIIPTFFDRYEAMRIDPQDFDDEDTQDREDDE